MKADIHPKYKLVAVSCGCGATFNVGSTYGREELKLDVCSECHPFYTGQHKIVDTAGRVDKFMNRYSTYKSEASAAANQAPKETE